MTLQESIQQKINQTFAIQYFDLINESHQHNVPANSETHFKLILVSSDFQGLNLVQRQQKIYQLLADELKNGVHALSLNTWTPEEWKEKGGEVKASPLCLGGSKREKR